MSTSAFLALDMPIRMNECGPDGRLRGHICFDYLQHLAALHAEKLGFGMLEAQQNNLIWILSRIRVHLDQAPLYDDILRVETYHNGTERIFAKRQFVLTSAKTGERFGYASSFWLCLSLLNGRPKAPATVMDLNHDINLEREDFFPVIDKLSPAEDAADPVRHLVSGSHIDLNGHLNNTYYCEYALDWIARKTGKLVTFSDVQINYNRAMQFGEEIIVTGKLDGDKFTVEGMEQASGKNSFQAQGTFRPVAGKVL